MSNIFEIKRTLNLYKNKNKISLLHCVSNYPSSIKNQNLNAIKSMKKFKCRVGYSDHTIGDLASIIAVTNGAEIMKTYNTR